MVAIASLPDTISLPATAPRRRPAAPSTARPSLSVVGSRRPAAVVQIDTARVAGVRPPLLVMLLAVVAFLGVAGLLMIEPLAEPGTVAVAEATHQVAEGETMWSIALDIAPAGQASTYVERLVQVNGGATVVPGQVLRLPAR